MSGIARKLAGHPRWRWREGMVGAEPGDHSATVSHVIGSLGPCCIELRGHAWLAVPMFGAVPDLDHPATKGWLLAMLREATGTMVIESCPDNVDGLWAIEIDGAVTWYSAPEGEALAHALLAAWDAEEVRGG